MTQEERWADELRMYEVEMRNRASNLNDTPYTNRLRDIWLDAAGKLRLLKRDVSRHARWQRVVDETKER